VGVKEPASQSVHTLAKSASPFLCIPPSIGGARLGGVFVLLGNMELEKEHGGNVQYDGQRREKKEENWVRRLCFLFFFYLMVYW